jgi:hypothetical protein
MWRIASSSGGRWIQWDGPGRVSGQPADLVSLVDSGSVLRVEIAPLSGEFYTPAGPDDPIAVFLRARNSVGGGAVQSGVVPRGVPSAVANLPGVVT